MGGTDSLQISKQGTLTLTPSDTGQCAREKRKWDVMQSMNWCKDRANTMEECGLQLTSECSGTGMSCPTFYQTTLNVWGLSLVKSANRGQVT